MSKQIVPWQGAIANAKRKFNDIARLSGVVNYDREAMFAMQILQKSEYLQKCGHESIRNAVINVAAVGISLNPAMGFAFLVPRKGQCVLDISYKGLLKIATDSGSVRWAKADLVYADDEFEYCGPTTAPQHKASVFSTNRGEIIGGYCVARTSDGTDLVETMTKSDFDRIRDCSEAKNGPWKNWPEEMMKKSIIKRASKTWPRSERMLTAATILNEHEGSEPLESALDQAKRVHAATIQAVKDGIATNNLSAAVEAWEELTHDEQISLWVAPTKGGPFTTKERAIIKSNEFYAAHFGSKDDTQEFVEEMDAAEQDASEAKE